MRNAFLFLFLTCSVLMAKAESIKSPDGNLELNFEVKGGIPVYQLTYKNKPVVTDIPFQEGIWVNYHCSASNQNFMVFIVFFVIDFS